MIIAILAKFILGFIFALCCICIFNLRKKTIPYFVLLPGLIFTSDLKIIILSLLLGLSLGLIYKHSIKFFPLFLFFLFAIYFFLRPSFNLFSDQGALNSINSQRGEDVLIYQNQFFAKLLHNKASYLFTFLSNLENYFTPARLFAGALYPTISRYYPLGLLFPWDILFLIVFSHKMSLLTITAIALLILPVGLTGPGNFGFSMALSLSFFLSVLIAQKIGRLSKTKYLLLIILMLAYITTNILTFGQFIGK